MDLTCLDTGLCQKIEQGVGLGHHAFWHGESYTSETHARTKVPQHEYSILRSTSDGVFWLSFMQSRPENAQKAAQHLRIISLMPTWCLMFLLPWCVSMALHLTLSTSLICLFIFCFPKKAPYSNTASFSWKLSDSSDLFWFWYLPRSSVFLLEMIEMRPTEKKQIECRPLTSNTYRAISGKKTLLKSRLSRTVAWWLRALIVAKGPGSVPSIHIRWFSTWSRRTVN